MPLMQDLDPDLIIEIGTVIDSLLDSLVSATIDVNNPDSLIMSFFNLLPIVGANPLPQETFILLMASVGAVVAYMRFFRE